VKYVPLSPKNVSFSMKDRSSKFHLIGCMVLCAPMSPHSERHVDWLSRICIGLAAATDRHRDTDRVTSVTSELITLHACDAA